MQNGSCERKEGYYEKKNKKYYNDNHLSFDTNWDDFNNHMEK